MANYQHLVGRYTEQLSATPQYKIEIVQTILTKTAREWGLIMEQGEKGIGEVLCDIVDAIELYCASQHPVVFRNPL